MIAGSVILLLTIISLTLIWINYKDNKQHLLEKLDLENQIVSLKLKTKDVKVEEVPPVKLQTPVKEFKYPTNFGSDRNKRLRDNLVKTSKDTGYSLNRSYSLWSTSEDIALQHRYNVENKSVQELAEIHERTVKSIATRLKILNLM